MRCSGRRRVHPSDAKTSPSSKTPVDSTVGANNAGHMLAEITFERWRPRYEPKTEPVVDHGEATRRKYQALPIDAGNVLAACRLLKRRPDLGGELFTDCLQLTSTQRIKQIAYIDHLSTLPSGKTLVDQVVRASVHRSLHLGTKTACPEC